MNLSFKKFKNIASMSEETECYTAVLCLDGRPIGTCSNRGTGGPDDVRIDDPEVEKRVYAFIKSQPAEPFERMRYDKDGKPLGMVTDMLPMSADLFFGNMVNAHLQEKEAARLAKSIKRTDEKEVKRISEWVTKTGKEMHVYRVAFSQGKQNREWQWFVKPSEAEAQESASAHIAGKRLAGWRIDEFRVLL